MVEETKDKLRRLQQHKDSHFNVLGFLASVIYKTNNCKVIVETGVSDGGSGKTLLNSCPGAKYYGYDNWNGADQIREHTAKSKFKGNPDATLIKVDTNTLTTLPENIDLIFVDGDHTTEGCLHDLQLAEKYLSKEGYIITHDMDFHCVQDAVKKWYDETKFESMLIKFGRWYGVYWRKVK